MILACVAWSPGNESFHFILFYLPEKHSVRNNIKVQYNQDENTSKERKRKKTKTKNIHFAFKYNLEILTYKSLFLHLITVVKSKLNNIMTLLPSKWGNIWVKKIDEQDAWHDTQLNTGTHKNECALAGRPNSSWMALMKWST